MSNPLRLAAVLCLLAAAPLAQPRDSVYPLPRQGDVIGTLRHATARAEDTLIDIARRTGLGYEEIRWANPELDPWLPGDGRLVRLPLQFVLPQATREGVVLNLPEMRLYHYRGGEVHTYPVGIGRMDWRSPLGATRVVEKRERPSWYPPESIIREHAERGDFLPKHVPPGPDNPLGLYALKLGLPGYLIHGTNKAFGIGMRVTHGCLRLYPEDIEALFAKVAVGTPVVLVNQPVKVGRDGGAVYIEAHPPLEEDRARYGDGAGEVSRMLARLGVSAGEVDWMLIRAELARPSGMPLPVSAAFTVAGEGR
jgi:L,D-transpeptidase ErfK/SrfK